MEEVRRIYICFAAFLCAIVIGTALYADNTMTKIQIEHDKIMNEIHTNADNLDFYIDGTEVNYNNIDLNQYKISYNSEEAKVFLTQKSRSSFVPMFFRY